MINRDIYSDPRIPECYNNKCQSIYIYITIYTYIYIHSQCMVLLSLPISWNIIVINKNINNNNPLVICQNVITESFFESDLDINMTKVNKFTNLKSLAMRGFLQS